MEKFAERLKDNFEKHRKEMKSVMDEMEPALAPILNEEQMKKFKKKMEGKRKFYKDAKMKKEREAE